MREAQAVASHPNNAVAGRSGARSSSTRNANPTYQTRQVGLTSAPKTPSPSPIDRLNRALGHCSNLDFSKIRENALLLRFLDSDSYEGLLQYSAADWIKSCTARWQKSPQKEGLEGWTASECDHQVVLLVLRMVECSKVMPLNPDDDPSGKFSPLQNRKLLENAFQSQQTGPSLPSWTPFDFHGEDRANLEARRTMLLAELLKDDPIKIAKRRSDLAYTLLIDSPWHDAPVSLLGVLERLAVDETRNIRTQSIGHYRTFPSFAHAHNHLPLFLVVSGNLQLGVSSSQLLHQWAMSPVGSKTYRSLLSALQEPLTPAELMLNLCALTAFQSIAKSRETCNMTNLKVNSLIQVHQLLTSPGIIANTDHEALIQTMFWSFHALVEQLDQQDRSIRYANFLDAASPTAGNSEHLDAFLFNYFKGTMKRCQSHKAVLGMVREEAESICMSFKSCDGQSL